MNNQRLRQVLVNNNGSSNWALLRIDSGVGGIRFDYAENILWNTASNRGLLLNFLYTNGDVGNIVVNSINGNGSTVDIGGDLIGDITIYREPNNSFGSLIDMIVRGDFLGDIDAPVGSGWSFWIPRLAVDGDIGSSGSPVVINTRGDVEQILAGGAIYADIDALAYEDGNLGRIFAIDGFVGTLSGQRFEDVTGLISPSGLFIDDGDLDADVFLVEELTHDIIIGGSFLSGRTIDLPDEGLESQITFNNSNNSTDWDGDILLDGVPLSGPPAYSNTAASVGGGAVGLVPFTLHNESSSPVNGAIISIYGMFPNQLELDCVSRPFTKATLRMYGPVELQGSAPHFDVLVDTGGGFSPVGFSYAAAIKSGTGEREVEVTKTSGGSAWPVGMYRIVPKAEKVTCLGAAGEPDVDAFISSMSSRWSIPANSVCS